jgi:Fe-Mn family superoxide dismutase
MYEHSYHMDFGGKAAGYVDAFMGAVSWSNAERLCSEVIGNSAAE